MAERPEVRLGIGGELIPTGINPKARRLFLRAVHRQVPDARYELMALAAGRRSPDEDQRCLRAWSTKWRFDSDAWLRRYAAHMVAVWRAEPEMGRWHRLWDVVSFSFWVPEFPDFAAWDPTSERENEVRQRFERY